MSRVISSHVGSSQYSKSFSLDSNLFSIELDEETSGIFARFSIEGERSELKRDDYRRG